jgi:filamentous hemagglutinin family protein
MQLNRFLLLSVSMAVGVGQAELVRGQIVPTADAGATGTTVSLPVVQQGPNSQIDIGGGITAQSNLFHSFAQFSTAQGQTANFLVNPAIQNILVRVNGGNASIINGLMQVTGGNANLYLMNPAGILFGPNATLNLSGSFMATTANSMRFGLNGRFSVVGDNNYSALIGNPSDLAFTVENPGSIVNSGQLALKNPGQSIVLAGGVVINTGTITTPGGKISIQAVPGRGQIELREEGRVLGFTFNILSTDIDLLNDSPLVNPKAFAPVALPALLTGGGASVGATGVAVNTDGSIRLTGSENITNQSGTAIVSGKLDTVGVQDSAVRIAGQNINTVALDVSSTDISLTAQNKVDIRDFPGVTNSPRQDSTSFQAGRDLTIQGNKTLYISAQNNPNSIFRAGADTKLISDDIITSSAKFTQGGRFSVKTLSGQPGAIGGIYDTNTLISSVGDVEFGNYEGLALKVESKGSIKAGNIRTLSANPTLAGGDPDIKILRDAPSVILRAGVPELRHQSNVPGEKFGGTNFKVLPASSNPATITVGNIDVSSTFGQGGNVIISAPGRIQLGDISTVSSQGPGNGSGFGRAGGFIDINSTAGSVVLENTKTQGGNVSIIGTSITAKDIGNANAPSSRLNNRFQATRSVAEINDLGRVNLVSTEGNIEVRTVYAGPAGINIDSAKLLKVTGTIKLDSFVTSQAVSTSLKIKDSPDVINFLIQKEKKFSLSDLKSSNSSVFIGPSSPEVPVGIFVETLKSGVVSSKVVIKHGGNPAAKFSSPFIDISGSQGGTSGLVIGVDQLPKSGELFIGDISGFDPTNPSSELRLIRNVDYTPVKIPSDSSGVAGIILLSTATNGSYTDSIQTLAVGSTSTLTDKPVTNTPVLENSPVRNPVVNNPVGDKSPITITTGTTETETAGTTGTTTGGGTNGSATTGTTGTPGSTSTNGTTGSGKDAKTDDQSPQSNDRQPTQKTPAPCKPANQTGGQKSSKAAPCPPAGSNTVINKLLDEQSSISPQPALPAKKPEKK